MEDPSQHEEHLPFRFRRKKIPSEQTGRSWQQIEARIAAEAVTFRKRLAAAAFSVLTVVAIVLTGWWLWQTTRGDMTEIRTGYGEIRRVVLPDSSVVFMNANSILRMAKNWDSKYGRRVWLEGEAYFEIQPNPGANRFVVHTSQTDVEVLGTKFNVNMLEHSTTVSLKEGKVQLTPHASSREVFVMKPGDEVQVAARKAVLKKHTNIDQIADWRNHRYHFDNTSFQNIADIISNRFGYEVCIKDPELLSRSISGDLYAADIDQFIKALTITMNLQIEKKDQELIIRSGK